ncbi:MAG TPA: DUF1707 domain-containing protein [Chloroflexota bacterium]
MEGDSARRAEPIEIRASDAERGQVVARLQAACVEGRLGLDEYGQRVAEALAARTRGQLDGLVADLPAEMGAAAAGRRPGAGNDLQAASGRGGQVSTTVAVLGTSQRSGYWRLASESRVLAIIGNCRLDLRSARIAAPVTTIDVAAVLGTVDVIVPAGVEVELEVHAVLGSRDVRTAATAPAPGAPVIRITGVVLLGALNVRDAADQAAAHIDAYG